MAGISPVGGISSAAIQSEYQIKVLKLGKDAIDEQGKRALQLIQSASSDPSSGQNLNVSV